MSISRSFSLKSVVGVALDKRSFDARFSLATLDSSGTPSATLLSDGIECECVFLRRLAISWVRMTLGTPEWVGLPKWMNDPRSQAKPARRLQRAKINPKSAKKSARKMVPERSDTLGVVGCVHVQSIRSGGRQRARARIAAHAHPLCRFVPTFSIDFYRHVYHQGKISLYLLTLEVRCCLLAWRLDIRSFDIACVLGHAVQLCFTIGRY